MNNSLAVQKLFQILFSLAVRRCRQSGILCRLTTSLKCSCESEHRSVRISISDTGVGSSLEEFRIVEVGPPLPEKWDGMLSITTTSINEKNIHHYQLNLLEAFSSRSRLKRLPSTSKHVGTFSGTEVCFSTVGQNIDELVTWVVHFVQKMLVLKAQEIVMDLSVECMHIQGSKHEQCNEKTEETFSAPASLIPISNVKWMRLGLEDYILKRRGSVEIACSTKREDFKVGIGHASNLGAVRNVDKVSDIAIVIVPMTSVPCCLRANSQTTEVLYFQDFSPSPISKSALSTLKCIKWQNYGLKLKEILVDREGNAELQWEDLPFAHIDIAIHSYNIKVVPTAQERSERKLVKMAVRIALDDLKAQYSELFLSSHAQKIQKYAPDLSRSIAALIATSNDPEFRADCASLLGLQVKDVCKEMLELRIEEKLVEIISKGDMKKGRDLAPGLFDCESSYDEDYLEEDEGMGDYGILDACQY